jgi:hypothetical protein
VGYFLKNPTINGTKYVLTRKAKAQLAALAYRVKNPTTRGWRRFFGRGSNRNNSTITAIATPNPPAGSNATQTQQIVQLFPLSISSKYGTNTPWAPPVLGIDGTALPLPSDVISSDYYSDNGAATNAENNFLKQALVIYYKDVLDQNNHVQSDVNVDFKVGDGTPPNVSWSSVNCSKTPNNPPPLQAANTAWAKLQGLNTGGLYRYNLNIPGSTTGVQVWLPTAGPDISSYWQGEINYFKNTWGPAYQNKLASRTLFLSLMSIPMAFEIREAIRLKDMLALGPNLDWEDTSGITGAKTPCGLANYAPANFHAGDKARFTMYGIVIDFAKRNNMMYALIGSSMGLDEITLTEGPDAKDELNKLFGSQNDVGTPDSPAALESYQAGFDLYNGSSLQQVMTAYGFKMQEPGSRTPKEWPSTETTTQGLTREASVQLQALIQ